MNSMNTSSMQKSKMVAARPDQEENQPIPFWERILARNLLPDAIIRIGIRRFLKNRLDLEKRGGLETQHSRLLALIEDLKRSPIAIQTDMANRQHYEVPARFYECCLGKHLKYSCGFWKDDAGNLDQAEEAMLDITVTRAELVDGQSILELGCGWGSLSLWMAERFPNSQILSVSNSKSQKRHIDSQAKLRGLQNLQVMTVDMNDFETDRVFDRVVSVEMFEHMRNYQSLMENISRWLSPSGKLFIHIFCHRELAYPFACNDDSDWMARNFFTGGIMPSDSLLLYFQENLALEHHWRVSGVHYQRTAEAWLANMDSHHDEILALFRQVYGPGQETRWWAYWRVFYMACAELWGLQNGSEWFVSHYLFKNKPIQ